MSNRRTLYHDFYEKLEDRLRKQYLNDFIGFINQLELHKLIQQIKTVGSPYLYELKKDKEFYGCNHLVCYRDAKEKSKEFIAIGNNNNELFIKDSLYLDKELVFRLSKESNHIHIEDISEFQMDTKIFDVKKNKIIEDSFSWTDKMDAFFMLSKIGDFFYEING